MLAVLCATPDVLLVLRAGESASPDAPVQFTETPPSPAPFWATTTCGVQETTAPAATYSTGRTAVTLCVTPLKPVVCTAPAALACSVATPAAVGVTLVEATPDASVVTTQLARPHAP